MDTLYCKCKGEADQRLGKLMMKSMTPTPNPSMPLPFEKYSENSTGTCNKEFKAELEKMLKSKMKVFRGEILGGRLVNINKSSLSPLELTYKAFVTALEAYTATDPGEVAEEALEMYSVPEAYNVKAMFISENFEEALMWYTKAITVAFNLQAEFDNGSKAYGINDFSMRSYFRALHGQANCLRKLGRYAEAEVKYRCLQKLDTYQKSCYEYAEWRFHILEVLMKQGKFTEADHLAKSKDFQSGFTESPSMVVLKWTQALLDYICRKNRDYDGIGFAWRTGHEESVGYAVLTSHLILEFLSGKEELPNETVPKQIGQGMKSWTLAAEYARAYLPLWQQTEGAIEWAVKNANTFFLYTMAKDDHHMLQVANITNDTKTFKRYLREGIYLDAKIPMLHNALKSSYRRGEMLIKAGVPVTSDDPNVKCPLCFVIYYDSDPRCVKLLIEHGCDPYMKRDMSDEADHPETLTNQSAATLAAFLLNARHLHAIFSVIPPEREVCDEILMCLIGSDTGPCMNGRITCIKCQGGWQGHSEYASQKLSITALLLTGYKPSRRIVNRIKEEYDTCGNPAQCDCSEYGRRFLRWLKVQQKLDKNQLLNKFESAYGQIIPCCSVCRSQDNLQKCSVSKSIYYCGSRCQKKDWKKHKITCHRYCKGS